MKRQFVQILVSMICLFILTLLFSHGVLALQSVTPHLSYEIIDSDLVISINGVAFDQIQEITWGTATITLQVKDLLQNGKANIKETETGIDLIIRNCELTSAGIFGINLHDGKRYEVILPDISIRAASDSDITSDFLLNLEPDYDMQFHGVAKTASNSSCSVCDYVPALGSKTCGNLQSKDGDPYPCCDNNLNGSNDPKDGNCTWYAWYRARAYWGSIMNGQNWGSAGNWHNKAPKDKFIVDTNPRWDDYGPGGYNARPGVAESTSMGHVAWIKNIYPKNGKYYIEVAEMNCGTRKFVGKKKNGKCQNLTPVNEICYKGSGENTSTYEISKFKYFIYKK